VVPAFNEELLLPECLESIKAEIDRWHMLVDNTTLFEIIVVDNNSTDRTSEIAKAHGATVVFETKKGLTQARQAGYNAAKYDYHAYIDADNKLSIGWLDHLYELDDNTVVGLSGPPYYEDQTKSVKFMTEIFYMFVRLAHTCIGASMQGGNFVIKKWALDAIGGHSVNILFYGEDTDLAARLSKVGKIKLIPDMWVYSSDRRYTEQGLMNTMAIYAINYFSIHFIKKPVTTDYEDFRPETVDKF
jgi:glycosyltransferase involved in cell wall biosynthesis